MMIRTYHKNMNIDYIEHDRINERKIEQKKMNRKNQFNG